MSATQARNKDFFLKNFKYQICPYLQVICYAYNTYIYTRY